MGKKSETEQKKKLKRVISKEERNRPKKKNLKAKKKSKPIKKKNKEDYSQKDEDENEESYEEFILPGQKFSTPPAGDATRAFYESLLEQRPDSIMAKKYCVEYGCLDADRANEYMQELEKKKKKNK